MKCVGYVCVCVRYIVCVACVPSECHMGIVGHISCVLEEGVYKICM